MAGSGQRGGMESESEVWQAISAFEQILELMPDDRSSLETLAHAYEHVGDRVKALDYLLRLAAVVQAEGDGEAAGHLCERLEDYESTDEEVRSVLRQLQSLRASQAAAAGAALANDAAERAIQSARPAAPVVFRVTDELAFAWKLFEAGEISQEEYSAVAHDLAELSVDPHLATVSVMHVLEHRAFSGMERVMGYVSRDTKTPLVSLQSFDVKAETAGLLSLEFMIRRGAVVFGSLLEELLVAVLNPYDQGLRSDVAAQTGRTCHFFYGRPDEFDGVITLLKDAG
jgi:tetratricopeptide (TPR) repeat protein